MFALPKFICEILDTLHTGGFEAFVVGGAVRDMLLGKVPSDFDITTSCPPETTTTLFKKVIGTGIKHGTVTVITDSGNVEVTTYRRDISYTNHRKPDNVDFISNLFEDLKRRDFTVNAFALSKDGELIDKFGGRQDLENKTIRAVGLPEQRFREDALRILRAFRFSARLDFEIEPQTFSAAINNCELLSTISCERIFSEFKQILLSDYPEKCEPLINAGGLKHLSIMNAQNISKIKTLPCELAIRFFAFCQLTNSNSLLVCKNFKADNTLLKYCADMTELFNADFGDDDIGIKNSLNLVGEKVVRDYYILHSKDLSAIDTIINNNEPYKISHLKLSGGDITAIGVSGKEVGMVLDYLLQQVITKPQLNQKEKLISLAKKFIETQFTI